MLFCMFTDYSNNWNDCCGRFRCIANVRYEQFLTSKMRKTKKSRKRARKTRSQKGQWHRGRWRRGGWWKLLVFAATTKWRKAHQDDGDDDGENEYEHEILTMAMMIITMMVVRWWRRGRMWGWDRNRRPGRSPGGHPADLRIRLNSKDSDKLKKTGGKKG